MTIPPTPAVDEETYTTLQDILADEFAELVEFFREDTQAALNTLQECLNAEDSAQVGAICHKLKSSGQLIGAFRLAEFARQLETYKNDRDHTRAQGVLDSLRTEYGEVLAWLDAARMAAA